MSNITLTPNISKLFLHFLVITASFKQAIIDIDFLDNLESHKQIIDDAVKLTEFCILTVRASSNQKKSDDEIAETIVTKIDTITKMLKNFQSYTNN